MATREETITGERMKGRQRLRSLTGPRKKKDSRQADEEAGFASLRYRDAQETNYNHDLNRIKLSSFTIGKNRKKLSKLQEDIRRKSQKKTSKELEQCKQAYDKMMADILGELKELMAIVGEKEYHVPRVEISSGRCRDCFKREKDMLRLQSDIDSLNQELKQQREAERKNEQEIRELKRKLESINEEMTREKEAKQEALTRLSAITSSRLRDNNPNLTDLSDPYRPSKIGELFSELYDNEWTNAYDELSQSKSEDETIQQLNTIVMTVYDCCMKLSEPSRSYVDSNLIKIDSELRQKIIGHFKQNGMAVIQHLLQGLEKEICTRCNIGAKANGHVTTYIRKCIEICWLMVVQDPPIALDNTKPEQFDASRFRGYQHNGPYTDYVVWPAIKLYKNGPLLSKGVAEGRSAMQVTKGSKLTGKGTKKDTETAYAMNQTWHPSRGANTPRSATRSRTRNSTDLNPEEKC